MNLRTFVLYLFLIALVGLLPAGCQRGIPSSPKLTKNLVVELSKKTNIQDYEEALGPSVKVQNPEGRPPTAWNVYRWVRWKNGNLTLTVGTTERGEVLHAYVMEMSK